jgi:hypothetical protein
MAPYTIVRTIPVAAITSLGRYATLSIAACGFWGSGSERFVISTSVHDGAGTFDRPQGLQYSFNMPTAPQAWTDRPLERGHLLPPGYLECIRGRIYASYERAALVAQPSDLFERFLELGNEGDTGIEAFARAWGTLGICKHGVPWLHSVLWRRRPACHPQRARRRGPRGVVVNLEPCSAWRSLVAVFAAALEIAEHLGQGRPGPELAWDRIADFEEQLSGRSTWTRDLRGLNGSRFDESHGPEDVPMQRHDLARVLTSWADAALVMLDVQWGPVIPPESDTPRLLLGSGTLFGALVVQLIQVCSGTRGIVKCSGCASWYAPLDKHGRPRWPQRGRRHFCPRCRSDGVPVKLAQEKYRRRKREERDHAKAKAKTQAKASRKP